MRILVAFPVLLLFTACVRPEVEAFRQTPAPVAVVFSSPQGMPRQDEIGREYAAALRARLATRVTVIPDGVPGPANAATLRVTLTEVRDGRRQRDPSPAAVGVTTGIIVGTLGAISGNRHAAFDGFWWGLWAGSHAAANSQHYRDRLGYIPRRVNADVALMQPSSGATYALFEFDVDPDEVIDAMDPLSRADAEDEGRIRDEEARAFSRVVVGRLQERFGWSPRPTPSFYGATLGKAEAPEPAPASPAPESPKPKD